MRRIHSLVPLLAALACADGTAPVAQNQPLLTTGSDEASTTILAQMDAINVALAANDAPYRVAMAESITLDGSAEVGQTLIQKDVGDKQLSADFVSRDPRRAGWSGLSGSTDDISYAIDQTGDAVPPGGVLTAAQATAAIVAAMATWDAETCSDLSLVRNGDFGLDIGLNAYLLSGGAIGSPFVFADVQHAGFRDLNFAGGVLGVTFTFIFTSGGQPTDIDNNGKADVAFREIYYDPSWVWRTGSGIDVESIALHEAGHGLSQAHFGNIVIRNDGGFDANPRAVMNAFYNGPFAALAGTDRGGHCSNWAQWPNR
jgi:hypothetical protein